MLNIVHVETNTSERRPAVNATPRSQTGLAGVFQQQAATIAFDRNEEIYGQGEPADYIYQVVRGAVRAYQTLADGRRQIDAFYRAGDSFGLEAGDEHSCTAEAIGAVTVRLVKRSVIAAMVGRDAAVASELWSLTARGMRFAQQHTLLLGRKNAEERVATFLLAMAGASSNGEIVVDLPMSRQDIADYLGLTIETVSRTFTHLEDSLAIELPTSRRVVLRSRINLQRLNG